MSDATPGRATDPTGGTAIKVSVRELRKSFSTGTGIAVQALDGVDLDIGEGEFVSLVGPSGCGKSTLLRMIASLDRPSQGQIVINRERRDGTAVGVVFQDYSILPWKTVEANVAFGLRMQGVGRAEALDRSRQWLTRLGLRGFERHYPTTLSGGMQQRVAIARALALNPEVLLLDEPFAALDAQLRELLQEEMLRQWQTDGHRRSAMLVTHSLDEAILLGDRVVLMSNRPGRISGEWKVPIERPRDPAVRSSAVFAELRDEIWTTLREHVVRAMGEESDA